MRREIANAMAAIVGREDREERMQVWVARTEAEPFSGIQRLGQVVPDFEPALFIAPTSGLQEGFERQLHRRCGAAGFHGSGGHPGIDAGRRPGIRRHSQANARHGRALSSCRLPLVDVGGCRHEPFVLGQEAEDVVGCLACLRGGAHDGAVVFAQHVQP